MIDKSFSYKANRNGHVSLVFLTFISGLILQAAISSSKLDAIKDLSYVPWILYGFAILVIIWAIAWFKAPAVFSGNMDTMTLKTSLFQDSVTVRWVDIHTIRYTIKNYSTRNGRISERLLKFELNSGQSEQLQLNAIDADFNTIQETIKEIAPHIKWVYPD